MRLDIDKATLCLSLLVEGSSIRSTERISDVHRNTIYRLLRVAVEGASATLQGDFNEDGRVDGTDLVTFGRRFGSQAGDGNYDEDADFNDDNRIDGQDLAGGPPAGRPRRGSEWSSGGFSKAVGLRRPLV